MNLRIVIALAVGASSLGASQARADENYFGYSYGSETLPGGGTEGYVWVTDRRGKDAGHYDAQDYKLELEHGVTNRFQVSGYLNLTSQHIRGLEPELMHVDRDFAFQGLAAEFKYSILSPYKDGIGLAFYAEPEWSRIRAIEGDKSAELGLELKTIVQKDFMDDRLIWAANITLEPEWERESEDLPSGGTAKEWEKELKLELSSGVSYRVAPHWFLGVEGRYASVYPNWTESLHREHYAISAGPSLHYGGQKWWFTLTYLPQLHGSPSNAQRGRDLEEFEKRELRLKVGYEF